MKTDNPRDQKETIQTQLTRGETREKATLKAAPKKCAVVSINWSCSRFHAKPVRLPVKSKIILVKSEPSNGNIREMNRQSNAITETVIVVFTL